jgi:hypothetical protein
MLTVIVCGRRRGTEMHEPTLFPAWSENKLMRRLAMLVTELDLDRRDFVIFGSGPLLAHGLRSGLRDLDIVARGPVWQRVSEYGCPDTGSINGAPMALFWNGLIQFSQGWISADWAADDLIGRAESVQGWPFAPLADVLAYKQILLRPKDHPDIAALHQAMLQPALGMPKFPYAVPNAPGRAGAVIQYPA